MFKKFTKDILDKEVMPGSKGFSSSEEGLYSGSHMTAPASPYSSYDSLLASSQKEEVVEDDALSEVPETIIGEHVVIKGSLSFQRLLRIDGRFEGELISKGKIIVGPTGFVKANINLEEAYIAGKVEGDVTVSQRLVLRGRAEVKGNMTAPLLSVDEGVSIQGQLNISRTTAPTEKSEEEPFVVSEEPSF